MTRGNVLPSRQRAVLKALVAGQNKAQAAESAGVKPWTVSRYLRSPVFVAALRKAQDEALGGVTGKMRAGADTMLAVLEALATDTDVAAGVRVRAALGWLAQLWRALELQDLSERVANLETLVGDKIRGAET